MTVVSVQSGVNQSLAFTVTGTWTTAYAQAFAAYSDTVPENPANFISLDNGGPNLHPVEGNVLYTFDQTGGTATAVGGYLFDFAAGASTVEGSGVGDTVLFAAGDGETGTYIDNGGSNQVIFVSGDNLYTGDMTASTGTDTIIAGAGSDTINTGTNDAIIDSGTGNANIVLNDTTAGSYNDYVYLDDGTSTVYADGTGDVVVANAPDQTLIGGTVAGAVNIFVLNAGAPNELTADGNAANLVVAGAASTGVFDDTSDNTIFGGSGSLYVVEGAGVTSGSVVGGTGGNYIYGASGSSLTFYAGTGDTAPNAFFGNDGSESVYGGNSSANLIFFAGQTSDTTGLASTYNETLVGGSGNDTFLSGSGDDTFTGGAGNNVFVIDEQASAANITITDFGASTGNVVDLFGFGSISSETQDSAGVTLTLSDQTTVTFLGITESQLSGHINLNGGSVS